MIYVMSDLHGQYNMYLAMLKKISFSDEDTLYILGDIVDRGDGAFDILFDIDGRDNVITLAGNHDLTALYILSRLGRPMAAADIEEYISLWQSDGGRATLDAFMRLDADERRRAVDIIADMQAYAEVSVGEREFILSHAGVEDYSPDMPLDDYPIDAFLFHRQDFDKPVLSGERYMVFGHTPTAAIEGAEPGRIYKKNNFIDVDCGASYGLSLGCLCLDDLREYYVFS